MGSEGSSMAMPTLPNVMAPEVDDCLVEQFKEHGGIGCSPLPAARRMYGSWINVFSDAPSAGAFFTPGCNTVNCSTENERERQMVTLRGDEAQTYVRRKSLVQPRRGTEMPCPRIGT